MAKKAARSRAAPPSPRSDAAEEARLAGLAAVAIRKERHGERLTRADLAARRNFEAFQLKKFGEQYLAAIPKKVVTAITGKQPKTLIDWKTRYGLPYHPGEDSIDGREWLAFTCNLLAARGRDLLASGSTEENILQLAAGPLKDEFVRTCITKNQLANEKAEIELQRLREEYVPIEPFRQYFEQLAGLVVQLSESMGRRDVLTGGEAQDMVADLARRFATLGEEMFGDGGGSEEENEAK